MSMFLNMFLNMFIKERTGTQILLNKIYAKSNVGQKEKHNRRNEHPVLSPKTRYRRFL